MGNLIAVEPTHTLCATRAACITRLVRRQRHRHKFSSPHVSCNLCLGLRGGDGGQGGRDLNGSAHKASEKPFDDRKANAVPQLKMPTTLQLKIKLQCKTIACTLELQMKG